MSNQLSQVQLVRNRLVTYTHSRCVYPSMLFLNAVKGQHVFCAGSTFSRNLSTSQAVFVKGNHVTPARSTRQDMPTPPTKLVFTSSLTSSKLFTSPVCLVPQ